MQHVGFREFVKSIRMLLAYWASKHIHQFSQEMILFISVSKVNPYAAMPLSLKGNQINLVYTQLF